MKTVKTIIGVLLILSALSSLMQLSKTERGAGFIGVLIGVGIFAGLGIWLISSANKK